MSNTISIKYSCTFVGKYRVSLCVFEHVCMVEGKTIILSSLFFYTGLSVYLHNNESSWYVLWSVPRRLKLNINTSSAGTEMSNLQGQVVTQEMQQSSTIWKRKGHAKLGRSELGQEKVRASLGDLGSEGRSRGGRGLVTGRGRGRGDRARASPRRVREAERW